MALDTRRKWSRQSWDIYGRYRLACVQTQLDRGSLFRFFLKSNRTFFFLTLCRHSVHDLHSQPFDEHISVVCRSVYVEIRRINFSPVPDRRWSNPNSHLCLGYLAFLFTFSADYRKFRTLQRNWFLEHANFITCNLPLLQALHWLPVQAEIDYKLSTIMSQHLLWLTCYLSFWPCHCMCTLLPGSFFLLQTHR